MDSRNVNFQSAIKGKLTLSFKSESYTVQGGDLKEIDLWLHPWGYEGRLQFLVMSDQKSDKLLSPFQKEDPISLSLEIQTGLLDKGKEPTQPLKLSGMVTERAYREQTLQLATSGKNPVIWRIYSLSFEDKAAFYWKRHFPLELYTESDIKTPIEQQKPSDLKIKIDWAEVLGKKHPQVLIPTAYTTKESASFYDFICWVTAENHGYFYYDYANSQYILSGQRQDKGEARSLPRMHLDAYAVNFPGPDYAKPNYLNANAKDASTQQGNNTIAITPLQKDYLNRALTPAEFNAFVSEKKKNFKQPAAELQCEFALLPTQWPLPGELLKFDSSTWSADTHPSGKTFRVTSSELHAVMASDDSNFRPTYGEATGLFEVRMQVRAEPKEQTIPAYPQFSPPSFPVEVEAYVFSDREDEKNATYLFAEDGETKQRYYQVQIPLWKQQKVRVPYIPQELNGQFYFPPYKKQRVLLALDFLEASIASYLDWRDYTTLPMDGQGNHIVMGKSEKSLTTIKHAYTNNRPQLDIVRTLEKDTETISIGEGYIRLHTKEEK